jgi:hypothetical protein
MHPKIYQPIRMSRSCKIACRSNPRMSTRTRKVTYTDEDASYSKNMLQNLLQSRVKTRVPKIYNRWLSSKLVPGMITGYVKKTMNTILWQKCLYDVTIFWQTRQGSNVRNAPVHAYSFGNSCSRRMDQCRNHSEGAFAYVVVESWSCFWIRFRDIQMCCLRK